MEPIRILHMIGSLNIGGSQAMLLNLYQNIDRQRIQFDFVLDHPDDRALASEIEALGGKIFTMPTFTGVNVREIKRVWNHFFTEHREYKVLHSHVRSYASLYLGIAKKYGVKTIIHSHSTSNGHGIKGCAKKMLQFPLRYSADYFFSCSEEAGIWLFGKKIVKSDRAFILKNAIDSEKYRFNQSVRIEYRKQLNLKNKLVYIHVGRFSPPKNHHFLLKAFRSIHTQNVDTCLLLVGDGQLRKEIEKQIAELGLTDSVHLLGNRHDVSAILQAADIFLFPSSYEGLGIVAVEAQAAGMSCICSDKVPKLAKVTDKCLFLPLTIDGWTKAALAVSTEREDTYREIVATGYDIKETAKWLQKFYEAV